MNASGEQLDLSLKFKGNVVLSGEEVRLVLGIRMVFIRTPAEGAKGI